MGLDIAGAVQAFHQGAEQGVKAGAEQLLEAADKLVPRDRGDLEGSGHVTAEGLSAEVAYTDPIAIIEHEDLKVHHSEGRSAKYLEKAMAEQADQIAEIIAEHLRGALH